ncbi:hypothetical protein Y032_0337g2907 [Ancylostoma ceylanicum]|uniref:Uncharacterized protein n=1 Tax=Ancylostoma ceylanicum TaxID=53326 RepID=A0A016RYB5_9BILA|nr:hypothetical protein Y032_0337g2907 [Ancylostoma ceylanicum]
MSNLATTLKILRADAVCLPSTILASMKDYSETSKVKANGKLRVLSPYKQHCECPCTYLQYYRLGLDGLVSQLIVRVFSVAFGCIKAPKSSWGAGRIDFQLIYFAESSPFSSEFSRFAPGTNPIPLISRFFILMVTAIFLLWHFTVV